MTPAVLGIDAGTTAVKAVLYSLEGETLAAGHRSVAVVRTADGGPRATSTWCGRPWSAPSGRLSHRPAARAPMSSPSA